MAGESLDVGRILTSPDLLRGGGLPARRQDVTTLAQTRREIQHEKVIVDRDTVAIGFGNSILS